MLDLNGGFLNHRVMRVLSLNVWGGRVLSPLLGFIQEHKDVDVFCFQEIYHNAIRQISTEVDVSYALNIFSEISKLLPDHLGFFRPVVGDAYGIAMFVKKDLEVVEEGEISIYDNPEYPGHGPSHGRNMQWVKVVDREGGRVAILNVHGLWNGSGKKDSPDRLNQSQRIQSFVETLDVPVILCGDFNLRPDTMSVKIFENQLDNLVSRYKIQSTRTALYPKEEKFADYIFTSPSLRVKEFQVLSHEVSDHSPLLVDFQLSKN